MDIQLFNKLMEKEPTQHLPEWQMFLEFCEMYLKKHEIENPIVVELGTNKNRQKKFYEQLLGARHIGIDKASIEGGPDILGNLHHPMTMKVLKEMLGGKPINILFIDSGHHYGQVKEDYEIYSPLCSDIIAFHDIENCRQKDNTHMMVWKLWDELKMKVYKGKEWYKDFTTLSIYQHKCTGNKRQLGIGMMIKG